MKDAMHVVHVMEAMHRGGAESLVLEHVRLAAPGVRVSVCALNRGGPALDEAAALGAATHLLEEREGPRALRMVAGIRELADWLRDVRADVVVGHNPTGGLYAVLAGRLAGIAALRVEHSLHYPGRHSALYPILEPLVTVLSRRVVCVCEAVLESHVRRLPWVARRFVTVANGISPAARTRPRQAVREALGTTDDALVVLTVGSLTPQKAQHVLVEAFASVQTEWPQAVLWVAGEGPRRQTLERLAEDQGVSHGIRFLGDRSDVADLMEAADLFVLSSEREGLPVTLLEAMRAGRPSVVTDVGGCAEAVEDGRTGRVVPRGDTRALASAMSEVLRDETLRRRMGLAAQLRWHERFTADRMVAETEALYGLRQVHTAVAADVDERVSSAAP